MFTYNSRACKISVFTFTTFRSNSSACATSTYTIKSIYIFKYIHFSVLYNILDFQNVRREEKKNWKLFWINSGHFDNGKSTSIATTASIVIARNTIAI